MKTIDKYDLLILTAALGPLFFLIGLESLTSNYSLFILINFLINFSIFIRFKFLKEGK